MNKRVRVVFFISLVGLFVVLLSSSLYIMYDRNSVYLLHDTNILFYERPQDIESFGMSNYECTASCYCEDTDITGFRRMTSAVARTSTHLVAAISSVLAYKFAEDYFKEDCTKQFVDEECKSVKSSVDTCFSVLDDEGIETNEKEVEEVLDKSGDEKCVLCVGDSLTSGYHSMGWGSHPYSEKLQEMINEKKYRTKYTVESFGISGECTREMLPRCKNVFNDVSKRMDVSHVIILGGTNDCGYGEDPDFVVNNLQCMYSHCLQKEDLLVFSVQVPTNEFDLYHSDYRDLKKEYNKKLEVYCENNDRVYLVDLGDYAEMSNEERARYWEDDKLHYTPEGYDMLARKIFKVLKDHL